MVVAIVGSWGIAEGQDVVCKRLTFPDENSAYNHVDNYTSTWTAQIGADSWSISNLSNHNWDGWTFIRAGRKNKTSVATITTRTPYTDAITKVDVKIDVITADKINSIKLYTSSNGTTWTQAGTYTKATGIQSVSLSSPTANLYYKIEFNCASGSSNGLVQVSKIEYYKQALAKNTVTFNAGAGSCDYPSIQESSAGSGVTLPSASPYDNCSSSSTFFGWSTEEVLSETTSVPSIVGKSGETYHPTEDITLYAVYKKIIRNDLEKTYNFSEIPGFDSWGNSYSERIVNYDAANVFFASASHQTGTITDVPVTKGNEVSVILRDSYNRIKEVSFVCRQWGTNTQTITLNYSTDGGETYNSTETTSTNFSISNSNLNANTNAIKLTFSNQSNQIGIESCTIKIAEDAIYTSNPNCTEYTIAWYINGRLENTVIYENNFPLADNDVPQNPETPSLCGSKIFLGWSETEFEETDDIPILETREDIVGSVVSSNKTYYAVFADNAGAPVNTILWEESWTGGSDSEKPSQYGFEGTTVYGGATLSYAQSSNGTILYVGTMYAGGEEPELLLSKNNQTWTISNIPTGGACQMSFTFLSNRTTFALTSSTPGITIDGSEKSWTITNSGTVDNFNLTLKNTSNSDNARIDNIVLKITEAYCSAHNFTTYCPCEYGITGIADGDMVWAGKSTNADWNSTINWTRYESGYHLAAAAPTGSNNVYIIENAECEIDELPHINEDATCGNFTINGFNIDIAENKNLTINGAATFTSGIINGNVVFGEDATVSGVSTSSHVDGIVTKSGAANGFTFPTGSNGNLGKVEVTDGTATNVSVQYFSNPAGFSANDLPRWWASASVSGFDHVSNVEYWRISSTEAITANFIAEASTDMHFNSETDEEDRMPANIQMAFYDNNRWTNVGGSASIDGNTLSINGAEIPASATRGISGNYTTFGSKSKSTVLPIELVSFTANCNGRSALIEWTTATEKNNDFFVLERSNDAVNFKEIARIAGAGNSIEPISYAYTDYGVRNGDNYYRLVQVDYDGTSTTSEIIVANCPAEASGEPEVLAFPNPFDDNLTLHFENFGNMQATVEVYDMLGRLVQTQKVNCSQNDYEVVLRLAGLSDGTYNVRISTADFVINRKVVKE